MDSWKLLDARGRELRRRRQGARGEALPSIVSTPEHHRVTVGHRMIYA